jgi:dipeptidyl aminopeptidase/acylaminoacyl peptidase
MIRRTVSVALLCLLTSAVLAQPDIASFTDYPEFEDLKISPKGTYLAFTQHADNREYLIVARSSDFSILSKISFGLDTDVQTFDWVNDERILLSPGRAFFGQLDFKQPTGEIFGVNADGTDFETLFGFQADDGRSGTRVKTREAIEAAGRIVDLLPDDPDHVIVQSIGYGVEGEFNQAWLMDVNTGALKNLARSPIRNGTFITDASHEVRYVTGSNLRNVEELWFFTKNKRWELLFDDEDEERWLIPNGPYGKDGKVLVRDLGGTGTWGLSAWDPETGQKRELFHHPVVDIESYYFDNDSQLWAIEYVDHFPDFFYPDESHPFVALHKALRATFKDYTVRIVDETDARDKVIVSVEAPQFPGTFLVMDTQKQEFQRRLRRYPKLPADALSRVDPIEFKARDGQTIRGYLTVPMNTGGKNLPMVVLPHGGPHGIYDRWTFDFETQLLASRGYAVLQVNFRGSGGRGEPFLKSGHGEWGGKMQDDVTDATRWAISDGVADPERICIYGGSYGAYAALTGAFKEPDLYKCAVGMSGVYDLNLMFSAGDIAGAMRGLSYLNKVLGEDKALLASRSPVDNADKIKAKVMLIHGKQDPRAPIQHAERMRKALRDQGKEAVWVTERGESHGIYSEENRVQVYEALLGFLKENIGN